MAEIIQKKTFVLALQFWEGDKETAMRNARRIADNEPAFRGDTEFIFVARFDTAPDMAIVDYVSKKFPTSVYTCTRRGVGWPSGCNDVWCDFMQESVRRVRDGRWADVNGVFTFEADCVPVHRDWINKLKDRWTYTLSQGKRVLGFWFPGPEPHGHINGNAVFHPTLAFDLNIVGCGSDVGWDWYFGNLLQHHWIRTGLIKTLYNTRGVPDEWMLSSDNGEVPILIHGVKDLSAEKFADERLRHCPANTGNGTL